jgi:hypothetical protein
MALGQRLAAARHLFEQSIGVANLEVPLSDVCETASFRTFASAILCDPIRFAEVHNLALHEYRRVNRLRSRTHPVPDLAVEAGWIEMPFWIWSRKSPLRRPLYIRPRGPSLLISDRHSFESSFLPGEGGEALERLGESDYSLRPRALITTMYSRLVLSSFFIHGIGGAKYDQLTDLIISRFFRLTPPGFQVLTATLRLPFSLPGATIEDLRRERSRVRELQYHPELFVDSLTGCLEGADQDRVNELIRRKRQLLSEPPGEGSKLEWHRELTGINDALQPVLRTQRERLESEIAELHRDLRRRELLGSREYSFVLHPASICTTLATLVKQTGTGETATDEDAAANP